MPCQSAYAIATVTAAVMSAACNDPSCGGICRAANSAIGIATSVATYAGALAARERNVARDEPKLRQCAARNENSEECERPERVDPERRGGLERAGKRCDLRFQNECEHGRRRRDREAEALTAMLADA